MLTLTLKSAKKGFFDREAVTNAVDKATRSRLSRFGAFVRTRARTSIRKRKGTSPPGQPPYSHVGLLRRGILFSYDAQERTVVIGPVRLSQGQGEAPALLEYGGVTRLRGKRARYRRRPFMRPAFEAELQELPELWKNSVR